MVNTILEDDLLSKIRENIEYYSIRDEKYSDWIQLDLKLKKQGYNVFNFQGLTDWEINTILKALVEVGESVSISDLKLDELFYKELLFAINKSLDIKESPIALQEIKNRLENIN